MWTQKPDLFVLLSFLITCFSLMLGTQAQTWPWFLRYNHLSFPSLHPQGTALRIMTLMKPLAVPPPGWVVINPLKMPPTRDSITQFRVCSRSVDRTEHPDHQTCSKNSPGRDVEVQCHMSNWTWLLDLGAFLGLRRRVSGMVNLLAKVIQKILSTCQGVRQLLMRMVSEMSGNR